MTRSGLDGTLKHLNMRVSRSQILLVFLSLLAFSAARPLARDVIPLNGEWSFRQDAQTVWKPVAVPSSFQSHEGTNFHGVGWYHRTVQPVSLQAGTRGLLHFQAAATEAEVWWTGERLGSNLGGWTPFRFDVTNILRHAPHGKPHEVLVRLDEKAGNNTQGFLPIIAPHFGGLCLGTLPFRPNLDFLK